VLEALFEAGIFRMLLPQPTGGALGTGRLAGKADRVQTRYLR
jgi:hypothetical protein